MPTLEVIYGEYKARIDLSLDTGVLAELARVPEVNEKEDSELISALKKAPNSISGFTGVQANDGEALIAALIKIAKDKRQPIDITRRKDGKLHGGPDGQPISEIYDAGGALIRRTNADGTKLDNVENGTYKKPVPTAAEEKRSKKIHDECNKAVKKIQKDLGR